MNNLASGFHGKIISTVCIAGQLLFALLPLTQAHVAMASEKDNSFKSEADCSNIQDAACQKSLAGSGNALGYSSLHRSQVNLNGTTIKDGNITFGDPTVNKAMQDTGGTLTTSQLSPVTNHPETESDYYSSGKAPSLESLQEINNQSDEEIKSATDSTMSRLEADSKSSSPSIEGNVYGAITATYNGMQGQLKDTDPIFNNTKKTRSNLSGNPFGDCDIDYQIASTVKKTHTTKKAYCTDDAIKSCTLSHKLEFEVAKTQDVKTAMQTTCHDHRKNCVAFEVGTPHGNNYRSLRSDGCKASEATSNLAIINAKAITKATVYSVIYAGAAYGKLIRVSKSGKDLRIFGVKDHPPKRVESESDLSCQEGQYGQPYPVNEDITEAFKSADIFNLTVESLGAPASVIIEVDYNPTLLASSSDNWGDDACRRSAVAVARAGTSAGTVVCNSKAQTIGDQVCVDGTCIDKIYISTVANLPAECTSATVTVNESVFSSTNSQEENQNLSSCSELDNKGCGYIGEECARYSSDNKTCLFTKKIYDCGYDDDVEVPDVVKKYDCPGGVACQGIDCVNIMIGNSAADMSKALALMQQAQQAQNDMSCQTEDGTSITDLDPSKAVSDQAKVTCSFFKGEHRECKDWDINLGIGSFGNNCCEDPSSNADWASYTRKIFHLWKMDGIRDMFLTNPTDFFGALGQGFSFDNGSGLMAGMALDLIKQMTPVGRSYAKVSEKIMHPFVNGLNNLIPYAGEVFKGAAMYLEDEVVMALSKFTIEVMAVIMHKFGLITLESGLSIVHGAEEFFSGKGGFGKLAGRAVTYLAQKAGFSQSEAAAIGSAAGSVVTVIGWVYVGYQITKMITDLLTKCNTSDFELATKRQLNQCDYVGKYCSKKIKLLGCVQRKKSYCCFNSPLSRILNKQVRYAINNCDPVWPTANPQCAFGGPKNPHCEGLTVEQVSNVDWTHVDLTEWLNLLQTSGAWENGTNGGVSATASEYLPIGGYDQIGRKHDVSTQGTKAVSDLYNGQ